MSRKKSIEPIPMSIYRDDQQLPSAIDSFWGSESNKGLQTHWIQLTLTNYPEEKPIILDGSLSGNIFKCVRVERGNMLEVPNLRYEHEEADDLIMLDNDEPVRAGYDFQELCMICRKGGATMAVHYMQLQPKYKHL